MFGCACCYLKQEWLSKERLVFHFGVNEDKVTEIQISAEKERKERETRRNALAIQTFLNFADVSDFTSTDFKLVIFAHPQNSPDTEDQHMSSLSEESESEQDESEEISSCRSSHNNNAGSDECCPGRDHSIGESSQVLYNASEGIYTALQYHLTVDIDASESMVVRVSEN